MSRSEAITLRKVKSLVFLVVFELISSLFFAGNTHGMSFQQEIGVSFTFNSTLRITFSDDEIRIDNLGAGMSADSNTMTLNIGTNSEYGYTLNATVGNDTLYDTDDLLHDNRDINYAFSSIGYTDTPTITSNTELDPNTWGFTFSTDSGTTWANLNGLPLYDDTEHFAILKSSEGPSAANVGDEVKVKIGAKAASSQASGDYSNVINFTLVATPGPVTLTKAYENAGATLFNGFYRMQDMTSAICGAVELEEDTLQVIDSRDNKVYWIAKLADGNCWMTQNLDLDLDSNTTYTHADTDLGWGSTIDATASWTPSVSTAHYPSNIQGWVDGYWSYYDFVNSNLPPYSLDPGDLYWSGSVLTNQEISDWESYYIDMECNVEGLSSCADGIPGAFFNAGVSSGNAHYSIGNYYDTTAAYAKNNLTELFGSNPDFGDELNVESSICPAGWRLPNNYTDNNDFGDLLSAYNISYSSNGNVLVQGSTDIAQSPLYFGLSGFVDSESYAGGVAASGYYYSSRAYYQGVPEDSDSLGLVIVAVSYSESGPGASTGESIRCIAR